MWSGIVVLRDLQVSGVERDGLDADKDLPVSVVSALSMPEITCVGDLMDGTGASCSSWIPERSPRLARTYRFILSGIGDMVAESSRS